MRRRRRAADGDSARFEERTRAASHLEPAARARPRHDRQAAHARLTLGEVGRRPFLELREACVRFRGRRHFLVDARTEANRRFVDGIGRGAFSGSDGQYERGTFACTDDDVLRPRRAVDEIPGHERPLLTLHHEDALASQDEEVLLAGLLVVHRHRHSGRYDVQVDSKVLEPPLALALEAAVRAELVVQPAGIARVDDEPATGLRNAVRKLRLRNHGVSMLAAVQVEERISALGFSEEDARILAEHFLDAERRGKRGHGLARVEWLETLEELDPSAEPECVVAEACYERWEGRGALGYLTLAAICAGQLEDPPEAARLIVAHDCFPTGMLGYWARRVATGGLLAVLTATSPPRLGHPDGGPKLTGTNPLAIAIPSSDGRPVVADVSMGNLTYGDVLAGRASEDELEPFGGEQAHKAFALAVGLQLLVDALAPSGGFGAVLLVARPEADPAPAFRALAGGVRLPGDR